MHLISLCNRMFVFSWVDIFQFDNFISIYKIEILHFFSYLSWKFWNNCYSKIDIFILCFYIGMGKKEFLTNFPRGIATASRGIAWAALALASSLWIPVVNNLNTFKGITYSGSRETYNPFIVRYCFFFFFVFIYRWKIKNKKM